MTQVSYDNMRHVIKKIFITRGNRSPTEELWGLNVPTPCSRLTSITLPRTKK